MNDTPSNPALSWRSGIFAVLALVMIATRSSLLRDHLFPLPDASWAVFFVAGFYFSTGSRERLYGLFSRSLAMGSFVLLMALAVLIDYFVISAQGIGFWQHYCVSPAYWFLAPAYATLWLGGAWLRRHYRGLDARTLGLLAVSAFIASSLCFAISDSSYYWLSDSWLAASAATRSVGGWLSNFGDWYWTFVRSTLAYLAVAALVHALATQWLGALPAADATRRVQH